MNGLHLQIEGGLIVLLNADTEKAVKSSFKFLYTPETRVKVLETGEEMEIQDMFDMCC